MHRLHSVGEPLSGEHRFYAEEAFSFHVRQHLPETLRILDMQDMHALRQGTLPVHSFSPFTPWGVAYCNLGAAPN